LLDHTVYVMKTLSQERTQVSHTDAPCRERSAQKTGEQPDVPYGNHGEGGDCRSCSSASLSPVHPSRWDGGTRGREVSHQMALFALLD
jgi:hypothetical protein